MEELFSQSSDELIDNNANPPEGLPDGIYTYPGVDALYKKENGQWFKKVGGSSYVQLKDGNVAERIKKLESDAIPVPKEKEEIQKFTNIQDFDVIQPAQQYRDVFEPQNNLLVKPKKEEKPKDVRIVDNNGIKTWQEEKERKVQQKIDPKTGIPMGPSYFTVYEDITDPTRVSNLNKSYKEDASTSKDQKVFTGYPGNQGTEYVLNEDNLWEVKRPGSDDFLIVSTPESVTALNNYFKQSADVFDDNKAIEIKNKNKQTLDLRYRINKVDRKLILGTEENAQEVLENLFPEYEFEQFGVGTDNIRVKSKSNEIEISLDNWSNESDETEALRLRSFLRENAGDIDESRYKAVMLQRKLDAQNKKYYGTFGFSGLQTVLETGKPKDLGLEEKTEEAREEFLIDLSSQYKDTYLRTKDKSEKEKNAAFASLKPKEEEISIINKYADDVLGQSNKLVSKQKDIEDKSKSISEQSEIIKSEKSRIELYVKNINDRIKSNSISQEELDQANAYIQEQYDILNGKINTFNKERKGLELDIDGINNESKSLQNNLKNVSLSQDLVNKSIAANLLIQKNKGSFVGGIAYSAVDGILSIPRMVAMADKETKDKWIKEIVGVGTTEAYINSDDRWDITKAAFQMSRSLSAMAVGSIGGTYGAYASLYAMSYYEMKDELDQLDIPEVSEGNKVLMSAAYGLVGGALENFGLSYLVGKSPLKSSLSNAILKNAFSQIPKNASKEMVEAQVMNSTKMMIAKYGITALGSSLLEGGVEGTQRLAQMGIQEVYDIMNGSGYFNNKSAYEVLGDVAYESYMGFLGGGIVETVQQSGNVLRDGSAAFKDKKQLNLLIDAAKTMGIDKALVSKLKSDILNGNIKKEEAEKQLNSFKEIQGKIRSIPDNMSVENQAQALDLILERDRLNQEIEGKDPNLVKPQSDRITEINNNLQELSKQNAVQEPSTEGVLQREQEGVTETGGERGGVEPIVQGEEVTKEGETTTKEEVTVDKEAIQKNSSTEVERVKSLTNDVEDGATFNLDGTKYEGKGLVVPVVSKNTTAEEVTPEMISDFVEEHKDKIGDNETVKVGIYKFPNSNKVSIDLNILAPESSREQAIEFGKNSDQESLFDLGTFENVKTGGTGVNPMQFTNDQFKEISKAFAEGRVPNVFGKETTIQEVTITPETSQTVTERINKETDTKRKKVFTAVQKVLSAIPNSRIILHDNVDAFVAGVAKSAGITNDEAISQGVNNNRGSYVNGDIHINLETAGVTTVFHEAFHDLLAKKGMDNNALLDMAKGLKSVISDKALKTRLDRFVSNYEQGERAEEYTTELGAIMAEAQKELSTTKFQQFKTLVNKIAKKLGMPVVFSAASNAQDAVDFMNSMAGKLGKGENILTDGFQTNIVSDKIKSQKPVKVNKDQKLTFVKQSDIIDIKSLINEIASKNQNVLFWVGDQLGRGLYFDNVINGEHYLDAGPSYALDPENRSKGIIWASGANPTTISNNIEKSDYIFIVSGSPQSSKLFNKSVANIVKSRIENKVDFNEFKNNILNSKPTKPIRDIINKYNSYDELFNGSDRKSFIIAINEQQSKDTQLKKLLESYDAFVDPNELRDGFYKENDFKMGDVMLVLKPEKIGDKSKHSTYETDIIGSVVGVPDMVINSYDLMPEEIKNKYKENLERAQQQQVVAPYGMGVKQISKIKAQRTTPGNKLFNEPLKDAETIAKSYMKSVGMDYVPVEKITKLDENLSKRISDAYDKMKNDPNDPKVKAAYEAMAKETLEQHKAIIDKGYKVEINNTEPYSDSGAMIEDLRDNKRMKIFSTESGFGDEPITDEQRKENPLLRDSGFKDVNGETLLVNDVFRFVHDFFGHAKLGNSFGPIGEENAWRVHSEMYSPEARKAMTSETRGQNSWVNFSGVNDAVFKKRDKARQLRKEGKIEEANKMVGEVYEEMSFADQKVGLLPDFAFEEGRPSKIKAQKQSKEDAIQDAKDKYELSVEKRGKDHKTGVTAAIADLQKSDWYRDADDTQREESIREIKKFFGEKLKAAPSVAKVTGKTKQTAFVSDLASAIRDQVKLQARSSRETAKNINDRRKALGLAIKQVVSQYKGKITERQLKSINTRIANVNLFNQEMVDRVISYVDKVMNNADYANKVNNAFAERRAIRRMMKSGNMAETVAVAKEFTQIDPSMVDDIDAYLEMAQKIRGAVKKSKRVKDSVSLKQIVNFGEAYEYIKPVLDAQEESMKNMLLAEHNDLADAGVISKDMTLKDINKILNNIRLDEKVESNEEESAREYLKNKLYLLKLQLGSYIENKGYNPLTGEVIEISDRNKQMIQKIIKSDMNNMSTKQLIEMVDSLSNFVENGAVGGIEAAYSTYVGEENAASLEREGVVARPLKMYFNKKLGQIFGTELTSLNELFNRMFVGAKKGMEVMSKSGFADVILGANKARRQVKEIQDRYVQRFGKNKDFFQIENVYERGVFAFLSRSIIGSESEVKAEFNRRVDMLLESVEALKNGTAKEQEMAKVYEKVLDKLDVKSRDLFSIGRKMSIANWDATQWWINEWSNHYSDLSDVSRSVYNTILGKDINYTPDRYKSTTEGSNQGIDNNLVERNSAFLINTDAITDTNESGVMIASVRPKVLPKGRYVSLDFDVNNIDSLTGALVDINTAGAIRQVDSFFKSKSFKSIVPSVEDRKILTERVNRYIRRSKNKLSVPSDVFRNIDNALNTVSSVGTALGLGGVLQSVKQTVSVAISTAIQTGTSFKIYAGQDFNNWLNTTGASVANRGQESLTAIESANKKIKSFNGTFDKAIDTYKNLTQWQLRLFLSRPDVFVARAAFKSYYEQFLKSKGYDVSEINFSTWNETIKKYGLEDLNKQAIIYADTMVSRQQNVSDERLAGELLSSEDSARKLIRKALLPFASFSINQRARLAADINALFLNYNNISPEDRAIAIKSIAGTTVEQGVFQMINFGIGMALYSVAQSMAGHDDDDEDFNKRILNATKYPLKSLLADMTSPNPLADDAVVFGADQLLAMFGSPSESELKQAVKDEEVLRELLGKDPMTESQINKFKEQYKKDNTYQLAYNFSNSEEGKYGMFSIAYDQYVKLAENSEMANNGTFTDEYMGKETTKYLTDKDKSLAKSVFYGLEVPYTTGAGVKEMGQVANKTYSIIKKRALTENQYEAYKEFKKEFKREPQEWEIKLIKSTKSADNVIDEVYFIQDQGGLSQKQGLEYLKVFKKIGPLNPEDYNMIVQGRSADYVIKKALK